MMDAFGAWLVWLMVAIFGAVAIGSADGLSRRARKVEELRGLLRESYRKLRDTCSCGACENLIARVAAVLGEKP